MAPTRTLVAYAAVFIPGIHVPLQSFPALTVGLLLLGTCVYTTILPNHKSYRLIRMALSIPAVYSFIDFAFSDAYVRQHNRSTYVAMGTVATYGMMKVLEYCWIRELDDDRPRWVKKDFVKPKEGSSGEDSGDTTARLLPLPETTATRLAYVFDLLSTIRGVSWWGDQTWDFAPSWVSSWVPSSGTKPSAYIAANIFSLAQQYLLLDLLDTFTKWVPWDKTTLRPVTSLPPLLQLASALSVCITTILYITVPSTFMATVHVALGGSPTCWPPMVNSPFTATSLRDFWFKWHHIFRRVFGRMSFGVMYFLPISSPKTLRVCRQVITFFFTATLHLILLYTAPPRPVTPDNPHPFIWPFFDLGTIRFFLAQPLGLILESFVVFPMTENLSQSTRGALRRVFPWAWLLFTGRYWADTWIAQGLYDQSERPIVWSPQSLGVASVPSLYFGAIRLLEIYLPCEVLKQIVFMAPERSVLDYLGVLAQSSHLPPEAYPSLHAGLGILGACIFTTTLNNHQSYRLMRMALSIPGFYFFHDFAFSTSFVRTHNRHTYLGLGTMACYGIMKLLEVCWIRELDDEQPKWLKRREEKKDAGDVAATVMPLPDTFKTRLAYTFDLLTSVRGVSWWSDRTWEYAPSWITTWTPPSDRRAAYVVTNLLSLIPQYLILDVVDTFTKRVDWDKTSWTPVTSLPLLTQVGTVLAVTGTTILFLTMPLALNSSLAVALGSSPACWAPMFNSPLSAGSLRDFWFKWHHIFRRVFGRISSGIMWFLPVSDPQARRLCRQIITFVATAMEHLVIYYTLPLRPPTQDNPSPFEYVFFDPGTLKFFLAQPLGLLLESFIIHPLTEMLPASVKNVVRRGFAWGWLFWSARFWCDTWVAHGLYDESERPIVWSPVRGLWRGEWII